MSSTTRSPRASRPTSIVLGERPGQERGEWLTHYWQGRRSVAFAGRGERGEGRGERGEGRGERGEGWLVQGEESGLHTTGKGGGQWLVQGGGEGRGKWLVQGESPYTSH